MGDEADPAELPNGRERLVDAAVKLFGRDGYDATSVRAVADEAGVSWGLIRFYFGSKEGLRAAAEERVVSGYIDLVVASAQMTSLEDLVELIEAGSGGLPELARFLRRALVEDRPIGLEFIRRLLGQPSAALLPPDGDYAPETWMIDPMRAVATRIGYLLLAPQFETLLGRDVFSLEEVKLRNVHDARMAYLLGLGLAAEKEQKTK